MRETYTDPLPQALVLTAIVISFGMTAVVVMIALGAYLGADDDHVDDPQPRPSADAEDAAMTHWIILPVVLPAILAPFIVLAARYHIGIQRVFPSAGALAPARASRRGWPGRRRTAR